MITDINQLDLNKKYTYADYLTWQFQERLELLRGKVFRMAPTPSPYHQKVSNNINGQLWNWFRNKPCEVYTAPFDVRLPLPLEYQKDDGKVDTVVQPDITVICDLSKIDNQGCIGAPDLVVEVLSPGNSKKEMKLKFDVYEHAGIKEYWLVDPANETIFVYVLNEVGKYIGKPPHIEGMQLHATTIEGFILDVSEVF